MKKRFVAFLLFFVASELHAASLPRPIVVLPFEDRSSRTDLGWISESFATTLMNCLSGSGRHLLGRRERDTAYNQLAIPAGTPITLASTYKVAKTLGADWVVSGEFSIENDILKTRTRVLDVSQLRLTRPIDSEARQPMDQLRWESSPVGANL